MMRTFYDFQLHLKEIWRLVLRLPSGAAPVREQARDECVFYGAFLRCSHWLVGLHVIVRRWGEGLGEENWRRVPNLCQVLK